MSHLKLVLMSPLIFLIAAALAYNALEVKDRTHKAMASILWGIIAVSAFWGFLL